MSSIILQHYPSLLIFSNYLISKDYLISNHFYYKCAKNSNNNAIILSYIVYMTTAFSNNFIDKSFSDEILNNVIRVVFPNLNMVHQSLLHEHLIDIINVISIKFNFVDKKKTLYQNQFRQNKYKDSIALLNIILPFMDDTQDKTHITKLNDIYTQKHDGISNINKESPKYVFSNIQYGRCNRDNNILTEIEFNPTHIKHNTILLKNTLQLVANKLFVNWIDVLPNPYVNSNNDMELREHEKKMSEPNVIRSTRNILSATKSALDNSILKEWDISDESDEIGKHYSGFPVSDIYNVIVNGLYEDIKNIKWLIYDSYSGTNIPLPFFFIIQKVLPLKNALKFKSWEILDRTDKDSFNQKWSKLLSGIDNIINISLVPAETYYKLMKAVVFFFNKYNKNINDAVKNGYIKFKLPSDDIDEDNEQLHGINFNDMIKSAKSLSGEMLYTFITDQFKILNNTYYGYILKGDIYTLPDYDQYKDKEHELLMSVSNDSNSVVTLKNYYNFAKSLSHYTNESSNYVYYGNLWTGLSKDEREEVLSRLNMKKNSTKLMTWFNISRYLTDLHNLPKGSQTIEQHHVYIFGTIKDELALLVTNIMAFKGIYSSFIPNPEISNEQYHPQLGKDSIASVEYIRERISKETFSQNNKNVPLKYSHYFLTNEPYSFLGPYKIKHNNEYHETDYYDYMTSTKTRQAWYTIYAMNWVSQISFFHRYTNNRIFYVTGSTGVGKSTQIPKLLMYALKAIDFNDKGNVVCTQPRIPPTEENATRIADELGLPIEQYDSRFNKKIMEPNYAVQYKHQIRNHIGTGDHTSLKIVTDGTLFLELKNPCLKKRVYNTKSNEYIYQDKNIYDIVIVDEAHEHNANMDMILTLMKNSLYYNNSIKLIIISATMADDEPIYRRFYRDINDNQMYPFDYTLQKYELDRINVDRRVHISPPGQTTRFTITEHYRPNDDPHDVIMEIIKTTNTGDILLFQSGEADILKSVQSLNKILPLDVIALPYFSSMHPDKKKEIQNIASLKHDIIVSHDAEYKYFTTIDDGKNKNKVNNNTYKRVIIIATNIAEASITIESLKFVVDTGKQKIGEYDPITHQSSLKEIPISESSRLQRKGRVGRTSSGTVYYMYKKNSMADNVTAYNISVQDIADTLFSLMRTTFTDNIELFDINNITSINNIKANIQSFVKKQYFKNNEKLSYTGNEKHYDYQNNTAPPSVYSTGYDTNTLLDPQGKFYVIHPEELTLKRNINGVIVDLYKYENITIHNGQIISSKMLGFWDILEERLCVVKSSNGIIKTPYGEHIYKLKERMKLDDIRQLIMYIFARQYGVADDIIKIIPLIDICVNSKISPNRWSSNYFNSDNKFRTNINKLKHLYGNCNGDISGILNCINKLFNDIDLFKQMPTENKMVALKLQKKQYIEFETNQLTSIDINVYKQFKDLDIKQKLTYSEDITEGEQTELIKNNIDETLLKLDLESKEQELKTWCDINYVDYVTIVMYLKAYIRFRTQLYKKQTKAYDIDLDEKDLDVNFKWFDSVLFKFQNISNDIHHGVNMALIHSFGSNICKNINGSNMYVNIQNPSPEFVYTIKTTTPYNKIYDTLLDQTCTGEYLLYFAIDSNTDSIYMIQNIDIHTIQQASLYLYTPNKIQLLNNIDYYDKMVHRVLFTINTDNKKQIISRYLHTIKTIYSDLINNFDNDMWRKLEPLCDSDNNLKQLYLHSIKEKKDNSIKIQRGGNKQIPLYTFNELTKFSLK